MIQNLLTPNTTQCKDVQGLQFPTQLDHRTVSVTHGEHIFLHKIWGFHHGESLDCGLLGYTIE